MEDIAPQSSTGPDLAALRRELGITQDALASRLGVHRVTVAGWEARATVDAVTAGRYRIAASELALEAIRARPIRAGGTA
jgi:transcriptional regulator with XRE-family HTH domain